MAPQDALPLEPCSDFDVTYTSIKPEPQKAKNPNSNCRPFWPTSDDRIEQANLHVGSPRLDVENTHPRQILGRRSEAHNAQRHRTPSPQGKVPIAPTSSFSLMGKSSPDTALEPEKMATHISPSAPSSGNLQAIGYITTTNGGTKITIEKTPSNALVSSPPAPPIPSRPPYPIIPQEQGYAVGKSSQRYTQPATEPLVLTSYCDSPRNSRLPYRSRSPLREKSPLSSKAPLRLLNSDRSRSPLGNFQGIDSQTNLSKTELWAPHREIDSKENARFRDEKSVNYTFERKYHDEISHRQYRNHELYQSGSRISADFLPEALRSHSSENKVMHEHTDLRSPIGQYRPRKSFENQTSHTYATYHDRGDAFVTKDLKRKSPQTHYISKEYLRESPTSSNSHDMNRDYLRKGQNVHGELLSQAYHAHPNGYENRNMHYNSYNQDRNIDENEVLNRQNNISNPWKYHGALSEDFTDSPKWGAENVAVDISDYKKTLAKKSRENEPPRFQCDACNKSYATHGGLSKHRQFHCTAIIKKEFSCKYCPKTYVSLGALKMHIRTHTLPCKCHLCGKAFSRPWLLQGHMRTHTGEKPFQCSHCGRSFADRSNLRAHLQTHTDIKKYNCRSCSKSFSRNSLLLKHEDGGCISSVI